MKLWSRGLGRSELLMDFRYYSIIKDPNSDAVQILGSITSPVTWEFRIVFEPEDVAGLIRVGLNRHVLKLLFKNAHRYFSYLVHRKQFTKAGSKEIETKVYKTYDQMVKGKRISSN